MRGAPITDLVSIERSEYDHPGTHGSARPQRHRLPSRLQLYNIALRAKKEVDLIVYAGEDHGLKKRPDQIDYQRRIFA